MGVTKYNQAFLGNSDLASPNDETLKKEEKPYKLTAKGLKNKMCFFEIKIWFQLMGTCIVMHS